MIGIKTDLQVASADLTLEYGDAPKTLVVLDMNTSML